MSERLLQQLRARPWLLVLDGLERVLVAYHRIDAAQIADDDAGRSDEIAHRDPCAAIRPEDDELLRALASAAPSKLLLTSRLIPRVLLNPSSQAIPGVLHERLPGLRPPDAEKLLRSCGVTGSAQEMQRYLKRHCDCHPLVTGVLAGLISNHLPDRGNFDAWAAAPDGGGALNLADLDLVQKRNHILTAALGALAPKSRQLLSTLALLSEAVDSATLAALNPHLPPEPEAVEEPWNPERSSWWERRSEDEKAEERRDYESALQRRKEYEQAVEKRRKSPAFRNARRNLETTVGDLQRRGLLQYDAQAKRYDLHPVVRGIAAGGMRPKDKERYGRRVVDHFSSRSHDPYEEARSFDDVRTGVELVRTLVQMGRLEEAADVYRGDLARALRVNLEAHAGTLALLRPFFPHGWDRLPEGIEEGTASYLANEAGMALHAVGDWKEALGAYAPAIDADLRSSRWKDLTAQLSNIANALIGLGRIAATQRCLHLDLELATVINDQELIFRGRLDSFHVLTRVGHEAEAEELWQLLDPMGREWSRAAYRPGEAEYAFARFRFEQGALTGDDLARAEALAEGGRDRTVRRYLHGLRGEWELSRGNWALAAGSLHEAVRMAREAELGDPPAEAQLALAQFRLGRLAEPRQEAEQLSAAKNRSPLGLAALWLAIGDPEQAKKYALAAYERAWADGEPYVFRYSLNRARALLEELGVEIPDLPPYDPGKDEKLPWDQDVAEAIERLREEKAAKAAATP